MVANLPSTLPSPPPPPSFVKTIPPPTQISVTLCSRDLLTQKQRLLRPMFSSSIVQSAPAAAPPAAAPAAEALVALPPSSPVSSSRSTLCSTSVSFSSKPSSPLVKFRTLCHLREDAGTLQIAQSSYTPAKTLGLLAALACVRLLSTSHSNFLTFRDFVSRLVEKTESTSVHVVVAILYLARLKSRFGPALSADQGSSGLEFRLFSVALMLSHKMFEDLCPLSKDWCRVCKIDSLREMRSMELEFLDGISYRLVITLDELRLGVKSLATVIASIAAELDCHTDVSTNRPSLIRMSNTEAKGCLQVLADVLLLSAREP
ncbi:hypothetical protein DFJ73DRAFT_193541 [Zopfochytrium polystomum]|nr:hypothetical protein DFJ73DRAFT_193541 [Zopfochytrium polystomum]